MIEGFWHTWTAIGSLLGIQDDLLPVDIPAARILMETILQRLSKASEEGSLLTEALLGFATDTLPVKVKKMPQLLMYHLNGKEVCDRLGVQTAPGCLGSLVPDFLKGLFQISERLEDRVKEPLQKFIKMFGALTTKAMVGYFDKYDGRKIELPSQWL